MCYQVKCKKCGKTTWDGCGRHAEAIMANVPENERCTCPRKKSICDCDCCNGCNIY